MVCVGMEVVVRCSYTYFFSVCRYFLSHPHNAFVVELAYFADVGH